MFGFFRRQSKKNDPGKSTSKKTKSKSSLNEIQCVPIDKYEIDFSRIIQPVKEPERISRSGRNKDKAIMGNSESSKKPAESTSAGNTKNDSPSNGYDRRKEATNPSTWSTRDKDGNTTPSSDLLQNGKTPGTENESSKLEQINYKSVTHEDLRKQDVEISKLTNLGDISEKINNNESKDNNIESNSSETSKCYSSPMNGYSTEEIADLRTPSQSENVANIEGEKSTSNEYVNKDSQSGKLPNDWPNSMSPGVTANEVESTKSPHKYAKQRQQSTEMSQDDTNYHEDGFDTAPSSPSNDAAPINQHAKIISPRERFFSSINPSSPEKSDSDKTMVKTESTGIQKRPPADEQTTSFEASATTESNGKRTRKTDKSINQYGCEIDPKKIDSNNEEYFEAVEQNDTEPRSPLQRAARTEDAIDWNMKQEIQQLPQRVEEFLNTKKSKRQIPDIMITESSDSENESESGEDIESYPCYDRAYPSILYDITEVDESFSDASEMEFDSFAEDYKRNVVHQESKFQDQIKLLKYEVETKDTENMQLRGKINDLQREIMNKTWGMDRLHAELASFQTEADCVRKKLLKVEEDLNKYKTKNSELNEELLKKLEYESDYKKVTSLQNELEVVRLKISELQSELDNIKKEKEELLNKLIELESEKNEKIKTLQLALDDTLKQKQKLQIRFEEEYEKLRTVNSDREQQLLNDFEWKLREVELTYKKKLEDRDKNNEDKIKQIRKQLQDDVNELKKQINELEKVKSYEAEVTQLRGLTHEQQRSLRMATRATEQLQSNERILNEEIERLRSTLEKERTHLATIQGIHSREISEKDRKHSFKLEQQKNEINSEWEDKFRRETTRLKLEMERTHKEEKRNLIEETKTKTEKQLQESSQIWEKKLLDSKKQMEELEQKLTNKEESYRKELLRLQTNSDRDMLELRRKLDKMDLAYQEQLEKKQELHEQEMDALRESCERKIQQSEQNWSQQISSTRATLELVKEQLQRESEDQFEALGKKYMLQLEQQYERLMNEKEEAISELQQKYSDEVYVLQNKLNEELKAQKSKEDELEILINQLKEELCHKNENEQALQQNVDSLHQTISELQEKTSTYDNLSKETDALLKKREVEHNQAISEMKERYENEIKLWQSKFNTNNKETPTGSKEKTSDSNSRTEEYNASNIDRHSRSSRRKGRGKRGQRNQHQQNLSHQFSSSSL